MGHTFNPSIQEVEAVRSPLVWGQPSLHSEFQDSQGYTEKSCLKKGGGGGGNNRQDHSIISGKVLL